MGGPSQATEKAQQNLANTQQQQSAQAMNQQSQLFGLSFPDLQIASAHYGDIAKGNPNAAFTAVAPAAENIAATENSVEQQIMQNMPRGGAKDLALAKAKIQSGSDIGNLLTNSYNSSFAALANMGQTSAGLSINELANSISGLGQASSTLSSLGSEQASGKAATLGFLSSLGGAGASALAAA